MVRWLGDQEILEKLRESVIRADVGSVESAVNEAIAARIDPMRVVEEGLASGLREVGERFGRLDCFLSDMMLSADAMTRGMDLLRAAFPNVTKTEKSGTIIIGTVSGDIHDIGKNIVSVMLTANGHEVHDLGKDVPSDSFISKAKELNADVIGLSALLSTTMPEQAEVVRRLVETNQKSRFKVIVGGAPTTDEWAKRIGADAHGNDAADAVVQVSQLLHR
jgi:dimethylamine corrinoid protein